MDSSSRQLIQEWMTRLADGDRSAFDPLFAAIWPVLRSFALRFLGGEADAEDAAQQAAFRVFARATEFDPRRDALSWIFGIVAYECRTIRQQQLRRRVVPLDATTLDNERGSRDPLEHAIDAELIEALTAVLRELCPDQLEVIIEAVGRQRREQPSSPSFRKRLQRARDRLRNALRWRYGDD